MILGVAPQFPRMTTTERDAITPVNGMIIYNITTNRFERYENDVWESFNGGGGNNFMGKKCAFFWGGR
jgi:hypothetical protein